MNEFLKSKLVSIALLILVAGLFFAMFNIHGQKLSMEQENRDWEAKIGSLRQENEYLQKFGDYFKSFAFLEKEARKRLNFKAPGEEVVFVYDTTAQSSRSHDFTLRLKTMANWEKWMYYILGK